MGERLSTRVTDAERRLSDDQAGGGAVQIWIDGTDPRASDEIPADGSRPRMFKTRGAADRWFARNYEPGTAVVFLDFNAGKTPAEVRAELKHRIELAAEHEEKKRRWEEQYDES